MSEQPVMFTKLWKPVSQGQENEPWGVSINLKYIEAKGKDWNITNNSDWKFSWNSTARKIWSIFPIHSLSITQSYQWSSCKKCKSHIARSCFSQVWNIWIQRKEESLNWSLLMDINESTSTSPHLLPLFLLCLDSERFVESWIVIWWYIVIYSDIQWYIVIYSDIEWYI